MGRLRRKRPASGKKKRRVATKKNKKPQGALGQAKVVAPAVQTEPAPNRVTVSRKEAPKAIKPSGAGVHLAFWSRTTQFLREVKIELKKVTWPSRKETVASTAVVLILVIIVSSFLGLVDVGLSTLVRFVLK
jgi:preprotein translocase subunit SecE